jgi:hypothetical protein
MSTANSKYCGESPAASSNVTRKMTIVEIAAELEAMGVRTSSNSTDIVREMRDERTRHLAKFIGD